MTGQGESVGGMVEADHGVLDIVSQLTYLSAGTQHVDKEDLCQLSLGIKDPAETAMAGGSMRVRTAAEAESSKATRAMTARTAKAVAGRRAFTVKAAAGSSE